LPNAVPGNLFVLGEFALADKLVILVSMLLIASSILIAPEEFANQLSLGALVNAILMKHLLLMLFLRKSQLLSMEDVFLIYVLLVQVVKITLAPPFWHQVLLVPTPH